jgi:hypothetical protein
LCAEINAHALIMLITALREGQKKFMEMSSRVPEWFRMWTKNWPIIIWRPITSSNHEGQSSHHQARAMRYLVETILGKSF